MSQSVPRNKGMEGLFIALPLLVICNFLYCLVVPASEYPPRSSQVMSMVFDAMMVIGLFGMWKRLEPGFLDDGRRQLETILFWAALAAGLGLFAIRFFGGDAAWWTGHLHYDMGRRY